MELPLLNEANGSMGTLLLIRDLRREPLDPYTIRRVEHLRRTLVSTLKKLLEWKRRLKLETLRRDAVLYSRFHENCLLAARRYDRSVLAGQMLNILERLGSGLAF